MIFVFKTPVEIAKRRAVLVLDTKKEGWRWYAINGTVEFYRSGTLLTVPINSIRYWRTPHDDQKQAPKQAV